VPLPRHLLRRFVPPGDRVRAATGGIATGTGTSLYSGAPTAGGRRGCRKTVGYLKATATEALWAMEGPRCRVRPALLFAPRPQATRTTDTDV